MTAAEGKGGFPAGNGTGKAEKGRKRIGKKRIGVQRPERENKGNRSGHAAAGRLGGSVRMVNYDKNRSTILAKKRREKKTASKKKKYNSVLQNGPPFFNKICCIILSFFTLCIKEFWYRKEFF